MKKIYLSHVASVLVPIFASPAFAEETDVTNFAKLTVTGVKEK
jgi:hypothetical protein